MPVGFPEKPESTTDHLPLSVTTWCNNLILFCNAVQNLGALKIYSSSFNLADLNWPEEQSSTRYLCTHLTILNWSGPLFVLPLYYIFCLSVCFSNIGSFIRNLMRMTDCTIGSQGGPMVMLNGIHKNLTSFWSATWSL